jgi:hypothetical protein
MSGHDWYERIANVQEIDAATAIPDSKCASIGRERGGVETGVNSNIADFDRDLGLAKPARVNAIGNVPERDRSIRTTQHCKGMCIGRKGERRHRVLTGELTPDQTRYRRVGEIPYLHRRTVT